MLNKSIHTNLLNAKFFSVYSALNEINPQLKKPVNVETLLSNYYITATIKDEILNGCILTAFRLIPLIIKPIYI